MAVDGKTDNLGSDRSRDARSTPSADNQGWLGARLPTTVTVHDTHIDMATPVAGLRLRDGLVRFSLSLFSVEPHRRRGRVGHDRTEQAVSECAHVAATADDYGVVQADSNVSGPAAC